MTIIQEHKRCIGCGACAAVCPKYWKMEEDGKAKPIGAKKAGENYELKTEGNNCNKQAADACPVECIMIK